MRWATWQDIGDHDSISAAQVEALGEAGRNGLHKDPHQALPHNATSSQLLVDVAHDCGRHSEPETLVATGLAQHERIDSNQFTFHVQQWTAAVSGINRRVGLDIEHGKIRSRLAAHGADDSNRHGIVETFGAADREHNLALARAPPSLLDWNGRQPGGLYLQERNICIATRAHNDRIQHLPFSDRFAICAHNHGIQLLPLSRGRQSIF